MHTVFPTNLSIEGDYFFYENWDEAPLPSFISWQGLVPKMEAYEKQLDSINKEIIPLAKKYEQHHFAGHKNAAAKYLSRIRKKQEKYDSVTLELENIELSAISHFTNIGVSDLVKMKKRSSDEELVDDNYAERYKMRMIHLANQPLPTDSLGEFVHQSLTDAQILLLEKERGSLNRILNYKKVKILDKKIKSAKFHTYKIKDIWEQTTALNKELQDVANDIVEEMKEGNFENLPYLIALLTIEDGHDSKELIKISQGNDAKSYVERYMKEVKQILEKRMEILFGQNKKLSVANAIRIKNFFLSKLTN